MQRIASRTGVIGLLLLGLIMPVSPVSPVSASAVDSVDCYDEDLPTTVEEQRLDNRAAPEDPPVAKQALAGTGLDSSVRRFRRSLCRADDAADAQPVLRRHGRKLWEDATRRAQSGDPTGDLPATDDRGLYWARISMTKMIRQWAPADPPTNSERATLLRYFERVSRGITSSQFSDGDARKVLVTGFDPFTLDADIRIGNPSGANALTLDDQLWRVGGEDVEIQTMVFPVRYADFEQGMVEKAIFRHYKRGPQKADLLVTMSQGRVGLFDLEVWNGRRRSVSSIGDNNNEQGGGTYTNPVVPPNMPQGPEWTRSTLPMEEMAEASVAPFTTRINTYVVEIPEGEDDPVGRPDGPTDGSIAVEGSGGGYLSNEIAYRNTLRRDVLAPDVPAGHLHVPVLRFATNNPDEITDPTYEANREAIIEGSHRMLRRGIAALA